VSSTPIPTPKITFVFLAPLPRPPKSLNFLTVPRSTGPSSRSLHCAQVVAGCSPNKLHILCKFAATRDSLLAGHNGVWRAPAEASDSMQLPLPVEEPVVLVAAGFALGLLAPLLAPDAIGSLLAQPLCAGSDPIGGSAAPPQAMMLAAAAIANATYNPRPNTRQPPRGPCPPQRACLFPAAGLLPPRPTGRPVENPGGKPARKPARKPAEKSSKKPQPHHNRTLVQQWRITHPEGRDTLVVASHTLIPDELPPLVFVHVGKAGGTSFDQLMQSGLCREQMTFRVRPAARDMIGAAAIETLVPPA